MKPKKELWNDEAKAAYNVADLAMIAEEKARRYVKRETKGDASETGLIRFLTPILMEEYGGPIVTKNTENALEEIRQMHPITTNLDGTPGEIPFSSTIKFNLIIRDMNKNEKKPQTASDNISVFIKGAPEKVLLRVSKILVRDSQDRIVEQSYNETIGFETEAANSRFGLMGERVLAFARAELDPIHFPKDGENRYQFDVKTWASWDEIRSADNNKAGWFPMYGLTLMGLVSLNDPPRPKVDVSVLKCRAAGVKVIMVTGDQPPTAAAIAHKVNIISKPEMEYNTILENDRHPDGSKLTEEEAFDKCTAIVIHGDTLAKVHNAEEALDDDEIEKGRKIMDWISKEEVVFARTTPSQKLLIVDACQQLGHVVAVTGDGVNDSPAIKQADIGIAMGSGSDVAQNAADMLLLDDNFSSIVNGVEEGRLIFDNLKKSIAYTLSSNIPEISPFMFFMIFQIPQPLSTVLILCIDLGTDMIPAISFAYENPELDIMDRFPRNSQRDHLVNSKLISFAYLQIGIVQAAAGFFTYFYIMNDYGFKPQTLFGLASEKGYFPEDSDVYDPSIPSRGNSNWDTSKEGEILDMLTPRESAVDVRLFFTERSANEWATCRWRIDDDVPHFYKTSNVSSN
jgi:sodium/potassium-transporting ATPase subunit alpha